MSSRKSASFSLLALALALAGCGSREPVTVPVDCSVLDAYEFGPITEFTGDKADWYSYADPTPHPAGDVVSQAVVDVEERCGDARAMRLEAHGYNFWGAGFADYGHETNKANGTGYDGISFWARTATVSERTFMLYIDEGRTLVSTRAQPLKGVVTDAIPSDTGCAPVCNPMTVDANPMDGIGDVSPPCIIDGGAKDTGVACTIIRDAEADDTDVNGDGFLTPGDIVFGTECRIPPAQALCDPACYYGGAQPPATTTCVPAPDQCGNQFHKYITTTDRWQLFFLPWSELNQWPCPNRLPDGIAGGDIRKFEIKLKQGMSYEIFLDNIAFYRLRGSAGG